MSIHYVEKVIINKTERNKLPDGQVYFRRSIVIKTEDGDFTINLYSKDSKGQLSINNRGEYR